jgi:hypothetical protein
MQKKIIDKMNEGQEKDIPLYTWKTIPNSLKEFWSNQLNK